jgi:hypothetical protein
MILQSTNQYKFKIAALSLLIFSMPSLADIYPGDAAYSAIIAELYQSVLDDNISISGDRSIHNRRDLCTKLVNRNNTQENDSGVTNSGYLNLTLSIEDCINALAHPQGYPGPSGFGAWQGDMKGKWYNDGQAGTDDGAVWKEPTKEPTHDPENDLDSSGKPRVYDFQEVVFTGRTGPAKYGWNQSHPEVPYVWGWDGKNNNPATPPSKNGEQGAHIGFTFSKDGAECIIWITKEEAFLECVKDGKRTSIGCFGMGQWEIDELSVLPPHVIDPRNTLQF